MNLIPPEERRRRPAAERPQLPSKPSTIVAALALVTVAAALGLESRSLGSRARTAEAERARLAERISAREGAAARLLADRRRLRELHARERRLLRWDEERGVLPELLRGLSRRVAAEVVFEEFRRRQERIWITGRVTPAASVSEATSDLARVDRVLTLELLWVERAPDAGLGQRFSVSGEIRYNSAEPDSPGTLEATSDRQPAGSR